MADERLVVGYETALDFWRSSRVASDGQHVLDDAGKVFGARQLYLKERAVLAANLCNSSTPIDVVVGSVKERHRCHALRDHIFSGPLGQAQLHVVDQGLSVCQPGSVLVQLAFAASELELALVAYELCGTYGLTPWAEDSFQTDMTALTSKAELEGYARAAAALGVRGAKRALAALAVVCDGSASPRESELGVFLMASRRRGGAELGGFVMNKAVKVPKKHQVSLGGAIELRPDYLWDSAKLAVEYDSNAHHLTPGEKESDEARRRVLEAMGYTVMVVTNELLKDEEKLDGFIEDLTQRLGIRRKPMSEAQKEARRSLRAELFGASNPA